MTAGCSMISQQLHFHLLTCEREAAGSAPGWYCRRWKPEWGWCCTHPPPQQSCCLAVNVTEPVTAAALLPWSLTGWRPWCWGPKQMEECKVVAAGCFCFRTVGGLSPPYERLLGNVLTSSNPWCTHSPSDLRRQHHVLLLHLQRMQKSRAAIWCMAYL